MSKRSDDISAEVAETRLREEREAEAERERKAQSRKDSAQEKGAVIPPEDVYRSLHRNHLGDAELLVRIAQGRYCLERMPSTSGKVILRPYKYVGPHWEEDRAGDLTREIDKVACRYEAEATATEAKVAKGEVVDEEEVKRAREYASSLRKRAFALRGPRHKEVVTFAGTGTGSLGITSDAWDQHPRLLPCANGVIDLATGKLLDGRPDQYLRRHSPVRWEGLNARCDFWEEILEKALCRTRDLVEYFGMVVGYGATGLSNLKDFYCAFGPGGDNGKSVIFETIAQVLGDFAATIPISLLLDDRYGKDEALSLETMRLQGTRFAVTSEAKQAQSFSMTKLKRIVSGGDEITARGLYTDLVTWKPTHTLFLHTNFMPKAEGNDRAFFQRLRVIRFGARFVRDPDEVDEKNNVYPMRPRTWVDAQIEMEKPGILAWIVRNARKYLETCDIQAPDCVLHETSKYQTDQDPSGRFVTACLHMLQQDEKGDQMKTIYEAFRSWCSEEGIPDKSIPSQIWLSRQFASDPRIVKVQERPTTIYNLRVDAAWRPGE